MVKYEDLTDKLKKTAPIRETKKGLISVIIPIFRNFGKDRLLLTIESIKNQEGVDVEIIVSEINPEPLYEKFLDESITYIFTKFRTSEDADDFSMGGVRNLGAIHATGEFIFTCDGDIILRNKHFLRDSLLFLEDKPLSVLRLPLLKRLPKENVEEFRDKVEKDGIRSALDSLHPTNDGLVLSVDGTERDIIKETFSYQGATIFRKDHDEYLDNLDGKYEDKILSIACFAEHHGSIILRTEHFDLVGGYCEDFVNWGWEDLDFHWKLERLLTCRKFFQSETFHVIHLDHDREYYCKELVNNNIKLYNTRKNNIGIYDCVLKDRQILKERSMSKQELIDSVKPFIIPTETEKDLLSVVIPIYGKYRNSRLLMAIESVKNQEGVNVEIVVSETSPEPFARDVLDDSIKYIFHEFHPDKDDHNFLPGGMRNHAVRASTGEYLFTLDADILFPTPYFLRDSLDLIKTHPGLILGRPYLLRLPKEDFEEFNTRVDKIGIRSALESLHSNNHGKLVTVDGVERDLIIVGFNDIDETDEAFAWLEDCTIFRDDYSVFISDREFSNGLEGRFFAADIHCGSNIMRREQFDLVGGYSEEFINWGLEDIDFQWKLGQMFNFRRFPKEFQVIHEDHDRSYIQKKHYLDNIRRSDRRKYAGIYQTLVTDIKDWQS